MDAQGNWIASNQTVKLRKSLIYWSVIFSKSENFQVGDFYFWAVLTDKPMTDILITVSTNLLQLIYKGKIILQYPDGVNRTNRMPNQLNTIERNRIIAIRLPNAFFGIIFEINHHGKNA